MASILAQPTRFRAERLGASTVAKVRLDVRRAAPQPPRAVDLLLDGLVIRLTDGQVAAAPLLQNAIRQYLREDAAGTADARWHDLTHRVCLDVLDQDTYNVLAARQLEALRGAGALTVLPLALQTYAGLCVTAGKFQQAASLLDESDVIITATGNQLPGCIRAYLAAYRGQEQYCRELLQTTIDRARRREKGSTSLAPSTQQPSCTMASANTPKPSPRLRPPYDMTMSACTATY